MGLKILSETGVTVSDFDWKGPWDDFKRENKVPNLYTTEDMQPLVLESRLFDRGAKDWTPYECKLFEGLLAAPALKGLKPHEKLAIAECMREAAYLLLQFMEERKEL